MKFKPPKGWDQESDTLFIHHTGVRIQQRMYRDKNGWFLVPAALDQEVIGFDPTPEGRDQAFAAFVEGKAKAAPTRKKKEAPEGDVVAKPKRGRKPRPVPENEDSEDASEEREPQGSDEKEDD